MLLVHNSMLKPSRSIKMLTFMLLAAVGRLDGDKRLEERRRNCCKGCCATSSTQCSMPCSCSSWHRWSPCSCSCWAGIAELGERLEKLVELTLPRGGIAKPNNIAYTNRTQLTTHSAKP